LNGLSRLKCPVAIIDESGTFALPAQLVSNPLFQVFRIAGASAGRDIARLLVSLGHRSAVYLSTAHSMDWSQLRYKGIQEIFTAAGWEKSLFLVSIEPFRDVALLLIQELMLAGFDNAAVRKIISVDRTARQVDDIFEQLRTAQKAGNLPPVAVKFKKRLQKNFHSLMDLVKRNPDKDFFDRMCSGALWAATNEVGAAQLEPLFEQALVYTEATAWICASDSIAASAVRFLKARNIAVPDAISVVGFDNRPLESSIPRLSSFDFNARAFVHRSLNFIAHPPRPGGFYRHLPIEIEGIVMERETTGKAWKRGGLKVES
jgi:DNA-binding LacI/PurR family transcriptional regulator